jgi:hypothetical protein
VNGQAQRRWADADFMLQVFAVRRQMRSQATGRISVLMKDAVDVLKSALTADVPTSRISAARTILRFADSFGNKGEELALVQQSLEQAVDKVGFSVGATEPTEDESY